MTTPSRTTQKPRYTFGRDQRLKGRLVFDAVFKQGRKRSHHPLTVHALRRPDNGPARLGISIGRRVGNAVARNLIKRRIREAYRLMQHDVPIGFDWLLIVRPHAALPMLGYQAKLRQLLT
jgi:ribonuclease P protein component